MATATTLLISSSFNRFNRQTASFPPKLPSFPPKLHSFPPKPRATHLLGLRCRNINGDGTPGEFLNEDGVVEDMDGYLNYLSLEYDSVWDTKPSWCQPWSIVLTGVAIVTCSWVLLNSVIISAGAFFLICAWWYIFLYSYPKEYSNMIAERRKRVTSGVEDTFGLSNSQQL